jgi:hypothetical protein
VAITTATPGATIRLHHRRLVAERIPRHPLHRAGPDHPHHAAARARLQARPPAGQRRHPDLSVSRRHLSPRTPQHPVGLGAAGLV